MRVKGWSLTGAVLAVVVAAGSCARDVGDARTGAPRAPEASPTASATARETDPTLTEPPRSIDLDRLPEQGIAVDGPNGVLLIDLSGGVIARLPGLRIAYGNGSVPGELVVERGRRAYLLDVGARRLRPLGPRADATDLIDQGSGADLPPPAGARYRGEVVGHWRWAAPSPDGSMMLAQWSGECEVPTVFFVDPVGGRPVGVLGNTTLRGSRAAFALGWTADGRAVVQSLQVACGSAYRRPGVYLFDGPGDGELLFAVRNAGSARMWGSA